jgi:hypothetical protein
MASAVPSIIGKKGSWSVLRKENRVRSITVQSAVVTPFWRSTAHASEFPATVAGVAQIVVGKRSTRRRFETSFSVFLEVGT